MSQTDDKVFFAVIWTAVAMLIPCGILVVFTFKSSQDRSNEMAKSIALEIESRYKTENTALMNRIQQEAAKIKTELQRLREENAALKSKLNLP